MNYDKQYGGGMSCSPDCLICSQTQTRNQETTPMHSGASSSGRYAGMSTEQEAHLARMKSDFSAELDAKYRKGAAEHGSFLGDLSPLVLIENAIEEVLDQYAYLSSLREQLRRAEQCANGQKLTKHLNAHSPNTIESSSGDLACRIKTR